MGEGWGEGDKLRIVNRQAKRSNDGRTISCRRF